MRNHKENARERESITLYCTSGLPGLHINLPPFPFTRCPFALKSVYEKNLRTPLQVTALQSWQDDRNASHTYESMTCTALTIKVEKRNNQTANPITPKNEERKGKLLIATKNFNYFLFISIILSRKKGCR